MENKIKLYQEKLDELLQQDDLDFNNDLEKKLPMSSGIYRIFEKDSTNNETIYIGISTNLRQRIYDNHFKGTSTLNNTLLKSFSKDDIKNLFAEKYNVQFIELEKKVYYALNIILLQFYVQNTIS